MSKTNAKSEFLNHIGYSNSKVICAQVQRGDNYDVDEEVIIIQFENGSQVKCTQDHEFYTENRGWVKAVDLNEFDDIREI